MTPYITGVICVLLTAFIGQVISDPVTESGSVPLSVSVSTGSPDVQETEDADARAFLQQFNQDVGEYIFYKHMRNVSLTVAAADEIIMSYNKSLLSEETRRQLQLILVHPLHYFSSKDPVKANQRIDARMNLTHAYNSAMACKDPEYEDCYPLDPDLTEIMSDSRDYGELLWAWEGFRQYLAETQWVKEDFELHVRLLNEDARDLGYMDYMDFRHSSYFLDDFESEVQRLWQGLEPLYKNLYAYTRRKLHGIYGNDYVNLKGPIPAHLLSDMRASYWFGLLKDLMPYPQSDNAELNQKFQEKNYTIHNVVSLANDFFVSTSMKAPPIVFWWMSQFRKPEGPGVYRCHPTAYDVYNDGSFVMIKMCLDFITMDFVMLHHEMGHIQYFLQYANQSIIFRQGANPAFHEAIGDVIALSVLSEKHFKTVGLMDDEEGGDMGTSLNFLMTNALWNIPRFAYSMVMHEFQSEVFSGKIQPDNYNTDWWRLRLKYQGIVPPVERGEYFVDYMAHIHNAVGTTYTRYFFASVLAFQIYEGLCNASGHVGPLHKCDFYKSEKAGLLLSAALEKGASESWQDILELLTGQRSMNVDSVVRYFKPLNDWLTQVNKANGDRLDWTDCEWRPSSWQNESGSDSPGGAFSLFLLSLVFVICHMLWFLD